MNSLTIADALNFWMRAIKTYEADASEHRVRAAALEMDTTVIDQRLRESTKLMADCHKTIGSTFELLARTLKAHAQTIAEIAGEEIRHEGRSGSGSVPGQGSTQGTPGPAGIR